MSRKIDAVTLFEREPGDAPEKSMKHGRHGDRLYLNHDGEVRTETAETVEFGVPVSPDQLTDVEDYPRRVQEFFGAGEGDR